MYNIMPRQIKNKTRPWNKIHIERFNWLYNHMEANYENINKDDFIDIFIVRLHIVI